ncbi:MAG: RNA-dependent DNA polymerase [Firmicutes bacterium]|nr:RNA-dependent DNA polymerase [Bacillota bacterium]
MAWTVKHLYPYVYDFESLYNAYLRARRCKRYRAEVLRFSARLEEELITLQNELIHHTFKPGRHREFWIHDPKTRLIMAPPFRDRVVHHALVAVIEPLFERKFITDSYACRVGKGTHAGADRVTEFLKLAQRQWKRVYCLKADVSQYFPSIHHGILKHLVRRTIACSSTLWLIDTIIDSTDDEGDPNPRGLPVGNLTSQLFANVYLNELDQFVKHTLRMRYYVRYMDDFVILHHDKRLLWDTKREIEGFLEDKLSLKLNHKTGVFPISQGIDFLGYRIWPTHRLLRKGSIKRARRGFKKLARDYAEAKIPLDRVKASIMSWLGHCQHANTYRIREKVLGELILVRTAKTGSEQGINEPKNEI